MRTFLLILFVPLLLIGCNDSPKQTDTDKEQAKLTAALTAEASKQVGMPNVANFQERKLMKMIMELRDKENLVCYAYIIAKYSGEKIFLGKCIGFGLPYSVQFTNPQRVTSGGNSHGRWGVTMPQPDPNGLFMPTGLSATWLMLINPETGDPQPVYCEPEILVSPFPLHKVKAESGG